MQFESLHPADQIVTIMNRIYGGGLTTTSGGNLSVLDDSGMLWISPSGIDKGALTREDIVCVTPEGVCHGRHKPSVELPIHRMVYAARPDVRAVLHAHPPALVAMSLTGRVPDTRIIPTAHLVCGVVAMAPYAVPGSLRLGEHVAAEFEKGYDMVLMENHGVVTAAEDLFQAYMMFETLEFCARLETNALRLGKPAALPPKYLETARTKQHNRMPDFVPGPASSREREARRDMCDLIRRAYRQHLITSTQGTFSCRLGEDSFVITPYQKDRAYLEPHDLVRIEGGACETGKTPSRSVPLHREIYRQHPGIHAVIIAHPPALLAFGISGTSFDSRTIPESYIQLRKVEQVPFGATFMQPAMVAAMITPSAPVLLAQNDAAVVAGASLLQAFDRLEVAEFSAQALISAKEIGVLSCMTEGQIAEIEDIFGL